MFPCFSSCFPALFITFLSSFLLVFVHCLHSIVATMINGPFIDYGEWHVFSSFWISVPLMVNVSGCVGSYRALTFCKDIQPIGLINTYREACVWRRGGLNEGMCKPAGPSVEPELLEAVPSGSSHQAPPAGLHHPHPALDIRAVLQGRRSSWALMTAAWAAGVNGIAAVSSVYTGWWTSSRARSGENNHTV